MKKQLVNLFMCASLLGACDHYGERKMIGTPHAYGSDSHYQNFMRYTNYMSKNYSGFYDGYKIVIDDVQEKCGETKISRSGEACLEIIEKASGFIIYTMPFAL